MNNVSREQKVRYKIDDFAIINQDELNAYNVPFAGNTVTCREVFNRGERCLEYTVQGDLTMEQLIHKPIFKEELIEYLYSLSLQMVSMVHSGLRMDKVLFDLKYCYVKLDEFCLQLLYLPLAKGFPMPDAREELTNFLSRLTYAHTPAIETAHQIMDYFAANRRFDVIKFNLFIKGLRAGSQLLMAEERVSPIAKEVKEQTAVKKAESDILYAEEATRNANMARLNAESEAKRLAAYAKEQREIAEQASMNRMIAESSRVQAEVRRQAAEKDFKMYSETAVLYGQQLEAATDEEERQSIGRARASAQDAAKQAEIALMAAAEEAKRLLEEARLAKAEEMRAEEASMQAEYESRKNSADAKKYAKEARERMEKYKELAANKKAERAAAMVQDCPYLTRWSTGEKIFIDKKVFCIGKAEAGVDYKITGNKSISRRHAYITNINDVYYLRDNDSTNHTYLEGEMLHSGEDVAIPNGARIIISNEEFTFTKD